MLKFFTIKLLCCTAIYQYFIFLPNLPFSFSKVYGSKSTKFPLQVKLSLLLTSKCIYLFNYHVTDILGTVVLLYLPLGKPPWETPFVYALMYICMYTHRIIRHFLSTGDGQLCRGYHAVQWTVGWHDSSLTERFCVWCVVCKYVTGHAEINHVSTNYT